MDTNKMPPAGEAGSSTDALKLQNLLNQTLENCKGAVSVNYVPESGQQAGGWVTLELKAGGITTRFYLSPEFNGEKKRRSLTDALMGLLEDLSRRSGQGSPL